MATRNRKIWTPKDECISGGLKRLSKANGLTESAFINHLIAEEIKRES